MNNNNVVEKVLGEVTNRKEAEAVVAKLLEVYSGDSAWGEICFKAELEKQSPREVARRAATNLFRSFRLTK